MAHLLDQRSAIRLLEQQGWQRGVGGKHAVKMIKDGRSPVTLPRHRGQSYSRGLTHAIIKQAGIEGKDDGWSSRSKSMPRGRDSGPRSGSSPDALPPPEL